MPEILIAALSPIGHIGPLLNVARGLVDRGDRVTVLSRADRADQIRAVGATPATLPPQGDLDLALLDSDSGREQTSGIKRLNFDVVRLFVAPMPHQAKALVNCWRRGGSTRSSPTTGSSGYCRSRWESAPRDRRCSFTPRRR